ncbi:MAG TPA: acetyl ornithine aminotransferase family protein [Anaerolineales bacterium]|nr:acetyl ornithine aminotransferase family protein [Anaerolineales bacterium]
MKKLNLPGPKAKAMVERDQKVISNSYPRDYPFVMDHGKGSYLWDVDGNKFIDLMSGIAVNSTGHSHPEVVKAIQEQAEKFLHISSDFYHDSMITLAEKLTSISPMREKSRVFLTNSGTEAVETALKLARYKTGRTNFIGFTGAFHGRTMGAVTMTASKSLYHSGFYPLMNGVVHAPFPNPYRPILHIEDGEDYGETVVRYIKEQIFQQIVPAKEVAGILVEPIQGEGGYILPPKGFFPKLRELCDENGILLIADEVQSGMGRTGKWWAIENFGVEPDIITSAKGIASGIPLGACIARDSVMDWGRGSHGNTYGGNPLSCVAGLKTIELIEKHYLENVNQNGPYLIDRLTEIASNNPYIGDVRGIGYMVGVEFVSDKAKKTPNPAYRDKVVNIAFEHGLLLLGCAKSVIRIAPPLSMTRAEIDESLEIFEGSLKLAL